jgi:hypothetical protein
MFPPRGRKNSYQKNGHMWVLTLTVNGMVSAIRYMLQPSHIVSLALSNMIIRSVVRLSKSCVSLDILYW